MDNLDFYKVLHYWEFQQFIWLDIEDLGYSELEEDWEFEEGHLVFEVDKIGLKLVGLAPLVKLNLVQ